MKESRNYRLMVQRYLENKATPEEVELYLQLLQSGKLDLYLEEQMDEDVSRFHNIKSRRSRVVPLWVRYGSVAAACVIGFLVWLRPANNPAPAPAVVPVTDIAPGGYHAILTLADGTRIDLDRQPNGRLPDGMAGSVVKQDNTIAYAPAAGAEAEMNILTTPAGGQYQVQLPDGTKVWMNAMSELRYPTAFGGKKRVVQLVGEAYFEVAKDAAHPFVVHTASNEVEVLGTHFNVMAYAEEGATKTTLLEGAVRVSAGQASGLLKPGQQAVVEPGGRINVRAAHVRNEVAWKDGLFVFDKADLPQVMRQISRWYDVEVEYRGNIRPRRFVAEVSRHTNLSSLLKVLRLNDIDATLTGKRIVIKEK